MLIKPTTSWFTVPCQILLKSPTVRSVLELALLSQERFPFPPSAGGGGAGVQVKPWPDGFHLQQFPGISVAGWTPPRGPLSHPFTQASLTHPHPHEGPSLLPDTNTHTGWFSRELRLAQKSEPLSNHIWRHQRLLGNP